MVNFISKKYEKRLIKFDTRRVLPRPEFPLGLLTAQPKFQN